MTRPAAIAVLPPIGGERTSTTRSKAGRRPLDYHSARHDRSSRLVVSVARTRLLPALLTALGVVLITAGLLSYADPTTAGHRPRGVADRRRAVAADPVGIGVGRRRRRRQSTAPSAAPARDAPGRPGRGEPGARARASWSPRSRSTCRSWRGPTATRSATSRCTSTTSASRCRTSGSPGAASPTYLFAHARDGMFGPIYEHAIAEAPARQDARDDRPGLHERRQALPVRDPQGPAPPAQTSTPRSPPTGEQLWLQTSEGPKGTPGKTQLRGVAALGRRRGPGGRPPQGRSR